MSDLNIEVAGGTSVRLLTEGKYCDKNIVVTALGSLTGYRYIRFIINDIRGSGSTTITQLSELEFIDASDNVYAYPSGATVTTNIPNEYPDEEPEKVIDGSTDTKFCSTTYVSGGYLQIDLGSTGRIDPTVYSRFRWYTANDSPERDPVSFEVRFSNDGINFDTGISVTGATITTERYALAYTGNCIEGGGSSSGRLPSGYTELEYIESTGTQYIDTGYSAPDGFVFDLALTCVELTGTAIFGSHNLAEPYGRNGVWNPVDGKWELGTGDTCPVSNTTITLNTKYTLHGSTVKGNSYLDVDGSRVITTTDSTTRSSENILVFSSQYNNNAGHETFNGKLYYLKIYDASGTLVRDFVPCKNASGEAGLYDLVNAEFYGNAGTGAFTGQVKESVSTEQATPVISVNNNGLITATAGTKTATKQLTTQGAKEITPTTTDQAAVASGVYTTGAVTVKGDANLLAYNIKSGVSIFGVTGTLEGATAMTVEQIRAICT